MIVHQALHGYRDGHRLLAASLGLPAGPSKVLLLQSDAPAHLTLGDNSLLVTGFPIPATNFYALSRTWRAQEGLRTGAVWTHSLLLDIGAVRDWPSSGELLHLLRYPTGRLTDYEATIRIEQRYDTSANSSLPSSFLPALITGIYTNPRSSIWVTAAEPGELDRAILSIWDQQWPALRSRFAFATKSALPRRIDARRFDLEGVPVELRSRFAREADADSIEWVWTRAHSSDWALATTEASRAPVTFPSFAFDVAEADMGREAYEVLARTYALAIQPLEPWKALADHIASVYPNTGDRVRTKAVLVGPAVSRTKLTKPWPESGVLRELIRHWPTFAHPQLAVGKRFQKLWDVQPKDAVGALQVAPNRDVARQLLSPLTATIKSMDAVDLIHPLEVADVALEVAPELGRTPEFWMGLDPGAQVDLFLAHQAALMQIEGFLDAVASGSQALQESVVSEQPDAVVDWVVAVPHQRASVPRTWLEALRGSAEFSEDVVRRLPLMSTDVASLVATRSDPIHLSRESLSFVERLVLVADSNRDLPAISAFAFDAALLNAKRPEAAGLVLATFSTLHEALVRGSLPNRSWRFLDRDLPAPRNWRDWDRAERVRSAALAILKGDDRSLDLLIESLDPDTRALLLETAESFGKKLGKALRRWLGQT